jgi:hypothetical protein
MVVFTIPTQPSADGHEVMGRSKRWDGGGTGRGGEDASNDSGGHDGDG